MFKSLRANISKYLPVIMAACAALASMPPPIEEKPPTPPDLAEITATTPDGVFLRLAQSQGQTLKDFLSAAYMLLRGSTAADAWTGGPVRGSMFVSLNGVYGHLTPAGEFMSVDAYARKLDEKTCFGCVLTMLHDGKGARRKSWPAGLAIYLHMPDARSEMKQPYFYAQATPGSLQEYPFGMRQPWVPDHADLLADDWMEARPAGQPMVMSTPTSPESPYRA